MKTKVFISFDYDHDVSQKNLLVGQSRLDDSPFEISDVSIKQEETDWVNKARQKIRNADVVIILCGYYTDTARGVDTELRLAREVGTKYYFLRAYNDKTPYKPKSAYSFEKIYDWTWDNLKTLLRK